MMTVKRTIVFICILTFVDVLKAQEQELRLLLKEQIKIGSLWTASFDGGYYRGYNDADWMRWGIRSQTSYHLSDKVLVDVGVMYNRTATPDQEVKNEFRPHQSIQFLCSWFAHMPFSHRFRMEEQFYTYNNSDKDRKRNSRFRYQIKTQRAFSSRKNRKTKMLYWLASLELFFNPVGKIQDDYILFNRGRHGVGIGYKLNAKTSLEGAVWYQHTHSNTQFKDYTDITLVNIQLKNSLFSGK